jgi:hypothetical protein
MKLYKTPETTEQSPEIKTKRVERERHTGNETEWSLYM